MAASIIEVLFEIPAAVGRGLETGDMVRRGGVIQWATGEAKGEVVMWLKESGALARLGGEVPARVTQQLAQLQMTTNVLAMGQAVTLGFSVLSFAVLNHKLDVLGRQVEGILAEIANLREDVAWLDRRQDVALEARLRGALNQGQWAAVSGRSEGLVATRGTLVEVEHHYRGLLVAMLQQRRAHRHPALFAAYQGHMALAGVGRVRCEAVLDGCEHGIDALRSVEEAVSEAEQAFRAPLRNLRDNQHLLRLGSDSERLLRSALVSMTETTERIGSYQTEFSYCMQQGITLAEWDEFGLDELEPRVLLLVPGRTPGTGSDDAVGRPALVPTNSTTRE